MNEIKKINDFSWEIYVENDDFSSHKLQHEECNGLINQLKNSSQDFVLTADEIQTSTIFANENTSKTLKVYVEKDNFSSPTLLAGQYSPITIGLLSLLFIGLVLKLYLERKRWNPMIKKLRNDTPNFNLSEDDKERRYWDTLIMKRTHYNCGWYVCLSIQEFQSFYAYCKDNNQDVLKQYIEKDVLTKNLQEVALEFEYWDILIMQLRHDGWGIYLSEYGFAKYYTYCKRHDPDALKVFVEKNLFTKDLQKFAAQNGYWDILTMQLRHHGWKIYLSADEFQSFCVYCKQHDQDALIMLLDKNIFKEIQRIANQEGYWHILIKKFGANDKLQKLILQHENLLYLIMSDLTLGVKLNLEQSKRLISFISKNEEEITDTLFEQIDFTKDLKKFIIDNEYWDLVNKLIETDQTEDILEKDQICNFFQNCPMDILKKFMNKNQSIKEYLDKIFQSENWYALAKYCQAYDKKTLNIKLNLEQSKKLISFISSNKKEIIDILFEQIHFTKDLKKFIIDNEYWDLVNKLIETDQTEDLLEKDQICNFFQNCPMDILKKFIKKNQSIKEYLDVIFQTENWYALKKYILAYDKKLEFTSSKIFWSFFRKTRSCSENIVLSQEIERDIFKPENLDLFNDYIRQGFRFDENREYLFAHPQRYAKEFCRYAQRCINMKQNDLTLTQKMTLYKYSDGECNFLTSQETFKYFTLPRHAKTGELIDKKDLREALILAFSHPQIIKNFFVLDDFTEEELFEVILFGPEDIVEEASHNVKSVNRIKSFRHFLNTQKFAEYLGEKEYETMQQIKRLAEISDDLKKIIPLCRRLISLTCNF